MSSETLDPLSQAPVERHLTYATQLLRQGTRPTVDLLVAHLGGSRTTAAKALNDLWKDRLPAMLDARQYEGAMPVTVREAFGAIWRTAMEAATEEAVAALDLQRRDLSARRAELEGQLEALEDERQAARDREAALEAAGEAHRLRAEALDADVARLLERERALLADVEQRDRDLATAAHELAAQRIRGAELQEALEAARKAAATELAQLLERMQGELAAARTNYEADLAAARRASAESERLLKEGYVESETRLRLALDEARTEQRKAEQAATALRGKLAEAEGLVAALRAQVDELKAGGGRPPWRRPSLRKPAVRR